MDPEAQKDIYERSVGKLRSTVDKFNREIMDQFELAFAELTTMYHTKSRQDKQKITEQQKTINTMQQTIDEHKKKIQFVMAVFGGLGSQLGLSLNSEGQKVQKNHVIDKESNRSLDSKGSQLRTEKRSQTNQNNLNGPKQLSASVQNTNPQTEPEPKVQENDSHYYNQRFPTIRRNGAREQIILDSSDEMEEESNEESSASEEEEIRRKNPLRCLTSHATFKITYIPNITKLSYTHYPYRRNARLDQSEVEFLDGRDLSDITSVQISRQNMNDKLFTRLTKLDWSSLKALKIDSNNITDITPLHNLNLTNLEDLDVSFNPLGEQSAEFLSDQSFDKLICLALSFNTGLDEDCWKIILDNRMENYPKIQAVDIGNSSHLPPNTKKMIEQCLTKKSFMQKAKELRELGKTNLPENFKIKITWMKSKQIMDTYDQEKLNAIRAEWQESVNYTSERIPRINAIYDNRHLKSNKHSGRFLPGNSRRRISRTQKIQKDSKGRKQKQNKTNKKRRR